MSSRTFCASTASAYLQSSTRTARARSSSVSRFASWSVVMENVRRDKGGGGWDGFQAYAHVPTDSTGLLLELGPKRGTPQVQRGCSHLRAREPCGEIALSCIRADCVAHQRYACDIRERPCTNLPRRESAKALEGVRAPRRNSDRTLRRRRDRARLPSPRPDSI